MPLYGTLGEELNQIAQGGSVIISDVGVNNLSIGDSTTLPNRTGSVNLAIGSKALESDTSGSNNTAIGVNALAVVTTGNDNTALGSAALYGCTTGGDNIAIGDQAGYTETPSHATVAGNFNTFVGINAGPSNTSDPSDAVAIGNAAGVGGNGATAIGVGTIAGAEGSVAIGHDDVGGAAQTTTPNEFLLGTSHHAVTIPGTLAHTGSLVGFFDTSPVSQQSTPATLAEVIALLQAYGLSQ